MHEDAKTYARKTIWKPILGVTMIVLAMLLNLRFPLPLATILMATWLAKLLSLNYDHKFRKMEREEPETDLSNGLKNHDSAPFTPYGDGR